MHYTAGAGVAGSAGGAGVALRGSCARRGLVGCRARLPQRLGDALPRDPDSILLAGMGCSGRACSTACSW